jgi:hypothetical protein
MRGLTMAITGLAARPACVIDGLEILILFI